MKNFSASTALILLLAVCSCKLPGAFSGSRGSANSDPGDTSGNSSSSTASSTTDSISPSGDAFADLKSAFERVQKVKAFQAVTDGTGGEKDLHLQVAYAAPDRFHVKNGTIESIIIGNETYANFNGTWRKIPMSIGPAVQHMRDIWTDEMLKTIHDVEYVGSDSVNGRASLVYKYASSGFKGGSAYSSKLWIAKDDGLPQKYEIGYSNGPLKTLTTSYEYNDVPIEPPIKN